MRVLIAPDKLKGSLTAAQAADAMARGVLRAWPDADVRRLPIADGGDGTVDALIQAGVASAARAAVQTEPGLSSYGVTFAIVGDAGKTVVASDAIKIVVASDAIKIVVAEVAQVGGLKARRPTAAEARRASSWAAGALVQAAFALAPDRLVVGIGGTASTDVGAGALAWLGARLLDRDGCPVEPGLAGLGRVASVDLSGLDPRLAGPSRTVELIVATDVDCPLTGHAGAVWMFGRQKGLPEEDLAAADETVARFAALLDAATGSKVASLPGAGAGGGLAAGLAAAFGTRPRLGSEIVFDLLGLDLALDDTDVVITAEGALDAQSLRGKAPIVLARRAAARGVPCLAVAGAVRLSADALRAEGVVASAALLDRQPDRSKAMADASALLTDATADLLASYA